MAKAARTKGDKGEGGGENAGGDNGGALMALSASPSHLLHRALQLALDVYADEAGAGGLTQRQYAVLAAVSSNEGLTQTDLVRATGIDRSTLADMVARMIGRDHLVRERSKTDARANAVHLTARGRAALVAVQPRAEAADARILAHLAAAKREAFITALAALAKAGEATLVAGNEAEEGGAPRKAPKRPKTAKPLKADGSTPKKDKKPKKEKKAKKEKSGKAKALRALPVEREIPAKA